MADTAAAMAANLIGTMHLPSGLSDVRAKAAEAWAYHRLDPYPTYYFGAWREEDRGPLPKCLPIARSIVRRGARWLFGRALRIECAGNEALESYLQSVWKANRMQARMRARAVFGAMEGGIALKFAWQPDARVEVPIATLSVAEECRLYYHPHDRDRLLMARIQYPYVEASTGETWWYREEWTDAEQVVYEPVRFGDIGKASPDSWDGWKEADDGRKPNPFGEIPLVHVRNVDNDQTWGDGDLWDLYRILDRIHLGYHLMDRSNQFDSDHNPIVIDGTPEDDIDRALQPGQPWSLKSDENGDSRQAKVVFPPSGNALRPAMMEYAKDLRKQVLEAAGSVEVDTEAVGNRGNLTQAVLHQLYLPQIEQTEEKRQSYGEYGIVPFLEKMARCLARVGVRGLGVDEQKPESYAVTLKWPAYFGLTQEELSELTGRLQEQELQGYVTHARAVREMAEAEGRDADAVEEELAEEPPARPAPADGNPAAARRQLGDEARDADGGDTADDGR